MMKDFTIEQLDYILNVMRSTNVGGSHSPIIDKIRLNIDTYSQNCRKINEHEFNQLISSFNDIKKEIRSMREELFFQKEWISGIDKKLQFWINEIDAYWELK